MPRGKIHNSFIDVLVAIGLDANTSLQPVKDAAEGSSLVEDSLFTQAFEPQVLAALSSTVAIFPNAPSQAENHTYFPSNGPPMGLKKGARNRSVSKKSSVPEEAPTITEQLNAELLHNGTERKISSLGRKMSQEAWSIRRKYSRRMSYSYSGDHMSSKKSVSEKPTSPVMLGDLPMPAEVLKTLMLFCFPDFTYVYREQPEDMCHFLVLTDVEGKRSYATCITYYRPFLVWMEGEDGDVKYHCQQLHYTTDHVQEIGKQLCYMPICCVLVSQYPYFMVMKDCLSRLVFKVKQDSEQLEGFLRKFALQMTNMVVPPAGKLGLHNENMVNPSFRIRRKFFFWAAWIYHILIVLWKILDYCYIEKCVANYLTQEFLYDQVLFTLHPSQFPNKPVVDLPLNLLFQSFKIEEVLKLMSCVLTSQRIVFIASSYSLLTIVMESLLCLLLPFHWTETYVPVVSSNLLELIGAPGNFLMGCHSKHRQYVYEIEDIVVADIDRGKIICDIEVPQIPEGPANLLKDAFYDCKCHFDSFSLEKVTTFMYEDRQKLYNKFLQTFIDQVLNMFLELMVNLFRDVMQYITPGQVFFNKELFLEGQLDKDKQFYKEVMQSMAFKEFLSARLAQQQDYWTSYEEKSRPQLKNSLSIDGFSKSKNSRMTRRHSLPATLINLNATELKRLGNISSLSTKRGSMVDLAKYMDLEYMQLPNFIPEMCHSFHQRCIQELTERLEMSKMAAQRAPLLYLRGMLNAAFGCPVDGLEDFHSLRAYDIRIFPNSAIIEDILGAMTSAEMTKLQTCSFYKRSELWKEINPEPKKVPLPEPTIPTQPMDLAKFTSLVQRYEIAADTDTITRLFESLLPNNSPVLDPASFEVFLECWNEVTMKPHTAGLHDLGLAPTESILKISNMMKCDFGNGRLALTQKKLIFISEGSKRNQVVVMLRDIKNLEKIHHSQFFFQVPALKIIREGQQPFVACLKEYRDWWHIIIMEMWAGKVIAEELRDPGIIQQAAQNVLLTDALLKSGQDPCSIQNDGLEEAAKHLSYFTRRMLDGADTLPPETKDVLQHQVDPNAFEHRKAIEALLYTAGNRASLSDDDSGPKLWCGLGSGKLRVFDASTWVLEKQFVQAKDRIVCLLAVGDSHVWAGSFDTCIYVVDVRTKTCNQTLMEHTDIISDLCETDDPRYVYSASINGQVIKWNVESLQSVNHILLDDSNALRIVQYINKQLWCCKRNELVVLDEDGTILRKIDYQNSNLTRLQLDCFLVTPDNELWLGCGKQGDILIWHADTFEKKEVISIRSRGLSKMVQVQDKVWVGTKDGSIYIYNTITHEREKELLAHSDSIRAMCTAQNRYVISGSGSKDGKIAIWRTSAV